MNNKQTIPIYVFPKDGSKKIAGAISIDKNCMEHFKEVISPSPLEGSMRLTPSSTLGTGDDYHIMEFELDFMRSISSNNDN